MAINGTAAHPFTPPAIAPMRNPALRCPAHLLSQRVIDDMQAHAAEAYPAESCGVVKWDGTYVRHLNTAANPLQDFRLPASALLNAAIIVHSHPDLSHSPSALDMRQQQASGLAWGIIPVIRESAQGAPKPMQPAFWGDQWPIPPLEGRPFVHGVLDCYSLIRDWYAIHREVLLPDFPREMDWWASHPEEDFYESRFAEAGFYALPHGTQPEIGDVFFAFIRSKVANHGGVYVAEGMILHHLENRLSKIEPVHRWVASKILTRWVRHNGP